MFPIADQIIFPNFLFFFYPNTTPGLFLKFQKTQTPENLQNRIRKILNLVQVYLSMQVYQGYQ